MGNCLSSCIESLCPRRNTNQQHARKRPDSSIKTTFSPISTIVTADQRGVVTTRALSGSHQDQHNIKSSTNSMDRMFSKKTQIKRISSDKRTSLKEPSEAKIQALFEHYKDLSQKSVGHRLVFV